MNILDKLGKQIVFFDGGMGTSLQEQGLKAGELPEIWNIERETVITELHKNYLLAGCDILKTNTFGANRLKFPKDSTYSLEHIIEAGILNAKRAISLAGGKERFVALDIGPTGKLLKPMGDLDFNDAYDIFKEVVEQGVSLGVDLILIETMSDSYEAKAAVLAAKENSDLPVFVTTIYGENAKLLTGGTVVSTVAMLEGLGADAIGINCGLGPVQMKDICKDLLQYASVPVIVNPNAGIPRNENGKTVFDVTPDQFSDTMKEIAEMGAWILGGCCGTTPDHIEKLIEQCGGIEPMPISYKNQTIVSSYSQAVVIGEKPVIIGERINPTGKSKFKQALRDNNVEYILKEGLTQQEKGAHILDVNVGLPEINEPDRMEQVIKEIQSIIDLPLQIDTSDLTAMERAMRIYNGKPMINSVNGKKEVMEAVFPLVKKYGGVVVGLALDEDGIPDTVKGRIAVAEKIYRTAESYGISRKDIVIDALAMTISSDNASALVTLETLERIKKDYNGNTILGVSNISFGLPQREIINSNFYTMALQKGLSCGIINPNSEAMMRSYYAYCALSNLDPQCGTYIERYANQTPATNWAAFVNRLSSEAKPETSLAMTIERGLRESAHDITAELLKTKQPLDLINQELIPALDRVGKGFEKGTVYLPQLLMSAEAAKGAFEVIKQQMEKSGEVQEKKGKIILATVKGDIHDIGKNIVKVLLESYSYDVLDLGKDVPPEMILETALREKVKLVGLSALMTTTVVHMEETIKLLRKEKPDTKIVVGGAVLTPEYANSIGADCYAKDAMATVYYAQKILG